MTYIPQTFANGDTNYIDKHNTNNASIASNINALLADVAGLKAAGAPGADVDYRLLANNLLVNGTFDFWQRGTTERPDAWEIENDETGFSVERSTAQLKLNTYSAYLNGIGQLTQVIGNDQRLSLDSSFSLAFGVWCYTATSNNARLGVYNGITTTWTDYHVGNSQWQFLRTNIVQGSGSIPTQIKIILDNGGYASYWNGAVTIRGNPNSGPIFVANDITTETLRVLSLYETGSIDIMGVGYKNGSDREMAANVNFVSPKRSVPSITLEDPATGYELTAYDVTVNGFKLVVTEIGGASDTDGFSYPDISWSAEA